MGSPSSVAEAFGAAADKFGGRLDALAHVAGIERAAAAEDITDGEWDAVFDVNVKGTVYTNQAAFRLMRAHGGAIINFTSGAALKPYPRGAHHRCPRPRWPREPEPWPTSGAATASGSLRRAGHPDPDGRRLSRAETRPSSTLSWPRTSSVALGGQLGDPDTDLAPVMAFLAGPGSRLITGQIIAVNGGMGVVR